MPTLLDSLLEGMRNSSPNLRGFWSNLSPGGVGGSAGGNTIAASARSTGTSPFSQPRFDFSKGVPAGLLGTGLVGTTGGGAIWDTSDSNPNSYGSKFGEQNANSYYIKYGKSDPSATQASRTLVPLDVAARALAYGVAPTWDSTHNQWGAPGGEGSRGGPNYGSRPDLYPSVQKFRERYQTILGWLNNIGTKPVGTPALNQLNAINASRQQQPQWRWGW
jgi:hypothetical protein